MPEIFENVHTYYVLVCAFFQKTTYKSECDIYLDEYLYLIRIILNQKDTLKSLKLDSLVYHKIFENILAVLGIFPLTLW